jgi:hypothetical protein
MTSPPRLSKLGRGKSRQARHALPIFYPASRSSPLAPQTAHLRTPLPLSPFPTAVSLTSEHQWLLSPEAEPFLANAASDLRANVNILKIVQRLRKQLAPPNAAVAIELAQLRLRATIKFSRAAEMFFTTRGYEQATSERLAEFKSRLVPEGSKILDLCCGIGGDLASFTSRHAATGLDLDPLMCEYARRNATLRQSPTPGVVCADALAHDWEGYDLIHIDPDRRYQQRTTDPRFIHPPLKQILERAAGRPLAIKLAPATKLPDELKPRLHREWIGEGRECKQQVAWLNFEPRATGRKSATLVRDDGSYVTISQSTTSARNAPKHCLDAADLAEFVYEPHSVVLAARLVDSLASESGLRRVAPGIGFLSGGPIEANPLLATFRVLSVKSAEIRQVSAELKSLDAGLMEWKKRGVDHSLYESMKKIRTKGRRPLTAIVTPLGEQIACLICERT